MNKFEESWKKKLNRKYEDNDLSDAVGQLIKDKKMKPLKRIFCYETVVVVVIIIILLLLK